MIATVDVGGTKIAVGMVDAQGQLLSRAESPTATEVGYASELDRTATMLAETLAKAGTEITGIGIGSTGPVDPVTGEIGDVGFFPHWRGRNPVRDLERLFHVSVAMENDADVSVLGEAGWNAGKSKARQVHVTVGTGIGAGVILDGQEAGRFDRASKITTKE
jgi:glucokinase